ncbi:MAG: ribosomal protein S18-alanine N-acetyltransferase [Candidatus Cloacimonadaceae bacterium]|nr:ribosomal protein S18-alanine N-acetyltransferase [Candidatus Cloacimonadota bacterium]MDY0111545.1 ribosomal protein S18-alanine N-acetyltransferase [Candidatus Syntrophosphaera sp.]
MPQKKCNYEMQVIRAMQASDLDEVVRIENLVFHSPWPQQAFMEAPYTYFWVICEDEVLQGYIIYHTVLDEGIILNFAIDPKFQHQGLGTRLLNETLKILIDSGIRTFFLDVRASNLIAQNLYKKFDFHPIGKRKNYYSEPIEDAIVMVKYIDEWYNKKL